jgi:hypothetical protein
MDTTAKSSWVIGADAIHGNTFDGHTLNAQIIDSADHRAYKSDKRMDRNYLKGRNGDRINVMLAACGRKLRKWMAVFLLALFGFRLNFQFWQRSVLT